MAIHPGLNSRYTVDQKKGEKTMAYLKGYVDHIRFRNEDNGYTVSVSYTHLTLPTNSRV